MEDKKLAWDLSASLSMIKSNIYSYRSGNQYAYLPVATELRKLLCDTQSGKNNSLILRKFPDFSLRPLLGNQEKIDSYVSLYIPGRLKFDGRGNGKIEEMFDEEKESLPLDVWLEQLLFSQSITIRNFIKSVADKEAAHADKEYNNVLKLTKSTIVGDDDLTAKTIIKIGCYVSRAIVVKTINFNLREISRIINSEFLKVGRGLALVDLGLILSNFLNGIQLSYIPLQGTETFFDHDPENKIKVMEILNSYDHTQCFIMLIKELDGTLHLFQQKIIL